LLQKISIDQPARAACINPNGEAALLYFHEGDCRLAHFSQKGRRTDITDIHLFNKKTNCLQYGLCLSNDGKVVYVSVAWESRTTVRGQSVSERRQEAACFHIPGDGAEKGKTIFPSSMIAAFNGDATVVLSGAEMYAIGGNKIARYMLPKALAQCILPGGDVVFLLDEAHTVFAFPFPEGTDKPLGVSSTLLTPIANPTAFYQADIGGQSKNYRALCITPDGGILIAWENTLCDKLRFSLVALDWEFRYTGVNKSKRKLKEKTAEDADKASNSRNEEKKHGFFSLFGKKK